MQALLVCLICLFLGRLRPGCAPLDGRLVATSPHVCSAGCCEAPEQQRLQQRTPDACTASHLQERNVQREWTHFRLEEQLRQPPYEA